MADAGRGACRSTPHDEPAVVFVPIAPDDGAMTRRAARTSAAARHARRAWPPRCAAAPSAPARWSQASLARIDATDGARQRLHRRAPPQRALRARRRARRAAAPATPRTARAAAARRAVRGEEPVRRRRPDARWPARRSSATGPPATRDAPLVAAPRGGRRGAGRRAQHGRVRLRLHHRELARRPDPQSARPGAHRRRLVGRLGRGGGGRPGAAHARLRHQRLDPRARRRCAACSA